VSENAVSPLGAGAEQRAGSHLVTVETDTGGAVAALASRASGLAALAGPLVALALGAVLLGRRPLTVDEAASVAAATGRFGDVVGDALERDPAQAGYLALLHPIVQLDAGERWVRAPSVVAAAVAALLVYVIGKAIAGRLAGLAASVLLAVAGSVVAVSQQARPYTLAIAAVCLSTALFVLALRRGHAAWWALYAAASALLPLTHPAASAAVVAQIAALALVTPRPALRAPVVALGFVVLENALLLAAFALDRREAPDVPLTAAGLAEGLARAAGWSPVVLALAAWGLVALATRRLADAGPWVAVLYAGLALLPLAGLLVAALALPVLPETALVLGAPGFALAAGAGLAALPGRWLQLAAGAAAVAAGLAGAVAWYAADPPQDWRAAARAVDAERAPGETTVVLPDRARAAFAHYAPDVRLSTRARGDGAWVLVGGDPGSALRAGRAVVDTPRYALLAQRGFGDELVAQHWVRP
jgi:mannosyltransferase